MQKDEFQTQLRELVDGVMGGKLSRREAIRRAGLLGVSAPVAAMLIRSGVASAQDATPAGEAVAPGSSVLPIPTDVCGNTTHSRDFLARDCRLPPLAPGELLALRDVGAYGYAMSSHFLNRPRPAEVVIDQGQALLTTRRETFADLLATQVDV